MRGGRLLWCGGRFPKVGEGGRGGVSASGGWVHVQASHRVQAAANDLGLVETLAQRVASDASGQLGAVGWRCQGCALAGQRQRPTAALADGGTGWQGQLHGCGALAGVAGLPGSPVTRGQDGRRPGERRQARMAGWQGCARFSAAETAAARFGGTPRRPQVCVAVGTLLSLR